mmetsp:Transcript_64493/g.123081  ORF Transcript_64493/g.123081 Transcript_64493/m.123081 type:complete len:200 (+) Transcript_64493:239-838(+)
MSFTLTDKDRLQISHIHERQLSLHWLRYFFPVKAVKGRSVAHGYLPIVEDHFSSSTKNKQEDGNHEIGPCLHDVPCALPVKLVSPLPDLHAKRHGDGAPKTGMPHHVDDTRREIVPILLWCIIGVPDLALDVIDDCTGRKYTSSTAAEAEEHHPKSKDPPTCISRAHARQAEANKEKDEMVHHVCNLPEKKVAENRAFF